MNKAQITALALWLAALLGGVAYATSLRLEIDRVFSEAIKTHQFDASAQRECIERKKTAVLVSNTLLLLTFWLTIYPGYKKAIEITLGVVLMLLLIWQSQYISP